MAAAGKPKISDRVIERASAYRRLLRRLLADGKERIYSHELAALEGATPAQVRRDLMTIGYTGSPARGYEIRGLIQKLDDLLDPPVDEGLVLVGVGQLGRAILGYPGLRRPHHAIVAAFDVDPEKTGRVIHGCHVHDIARLSEVLGALNIVVGIITVPASAAQDAADRLVEAGVRGLVNFAPVRLRVPAHIHVEDVDITMLFEKVAYLARGQERRRTSRDRS